jgi:dTDP-4-dehydrorhamnose 3,5-epimerase
VTVRQRQKHHLGSIGIAVEFVKLPVAGALLVRLEARADERGFFARTFCVDEFAAAGLPADFPQQSMARSGRAGTLRGMHLQLEPHAEAKYVRCTRGRIFDAFVDLRPDSPTFRRSASVTLDGESGDALFVPAGCAHGYQTLVDDTDVIYAMSSRYAPAAARSIRYDDPLMRIAWPLSDPTLSTADREAPGLEEFLRDRG